MSHYLDPKLPEHNLKLGICKKKSLNPVDIMVVHLKSDARPGIQAGSGS